MIAIPMPFPRIGARGFAHMHIDRDGEASFDALFGLVAASAIRSIDIRCKRCPHLGEDEGRLLQLVCLSQDDRLAEAAAILGDWLPAGTVRQAVGAGASLRRQTRRALDPAPVNRRAAGSDAGGRPINGDNS
jgi:hypothetical protein